MFDHFTGSALKGLTYIFFKEQWLIKELGHFKSFRSKFDVIVTEIPLFLRFFRVDNIWVIWDKVFKNGLNKICGRQPLKNNEGIWLSRQYPFKFFKGCLPQILLDSFLNTLPYFFLKLIRLLVMHLLFVKFCPVFLGNELCTFNR